MIPTVAIVESEMSLHAGQEKKLLRGQIIIAKVTLERTHYVVWLLGGKTREQPHTTYHTSGITC